MVLSGLIAGGFSLASSPLAWPEQIDVPLFESGRYQFIILQPQRDVPDVRLFHIDGSTVLLSSLRGRPTLLNFWATWCPPCRTELPILDQLQGERAPQSGSGGLKVLAVAVDRADRSTVVRFVQTLGISHLPIYRDPNGYVASPEPDRRNAPFVLYGMPITYLISASGKVVGYMLGAADWNGEAAGKLLAYLNRS